jgi:hypothetical protein
MQYVSIDLIKAIQAERLREAAQSRRVGTFRREVRYGRRPVRWRRAIPRMRPRAV